LSFGLPDIAVERATLGSVTDRFVVLSPPWSLLLPASFLLLTGANLSDVRKAGRVAGQSLTAFLFGTMQADRLWSLDG